jgi:hypothetical protein
MKFTVMENTENDKQENINTDKEVRRYHGGGRIWIPLGLLFVGGALLARQLGLDMPNWLFSWQMIFSF